MDKEFLQHIKETGYYDLMYFDEEAIAKYKNTLFYLKWQLENAWINLAKAIKNTKEVKFYKKCITHFIK